MLRSFVVHALVVALAVTAAGRANGAPQVTATVSASTGHDSNALLEVSPTGTQARARGWFGGAEADLALTLRRQGWSAFAQYNGDARQAPAFGGILWHVLEMGAQWRQRTTRFEAAWAGQQLFTSRYVDDNWIGTGPRLGGSVASAERWRLRLDLGTQGRQGTGPTQFYSHTSMSLRWSNSAAAAVGLSAQGAWLTTSLFDTQPLWQRYRCSPFGTLLWHGFAMTAAPFIGTRRLAGQAVGQFGAQAAVERLLLWGLHARAGIDFTKEFGATSAGRTDRLEATLALSWSSPNHTPPPPAASLAAADLAPRILAGRLRFRIRAPAARKVEVLGSFDNWGAGINLSRLDSEADGVWEGWLANPACGPLRYHFMVDDVAASPVQAPRYVADAFGGTDGEIDISVAPCPNVENSAPDVSPGTTSSF